MSLGLSTISSGQSSDLLFDSFLPQGGTWDVADVQWNPHIARKEYIVSTSSEKLCAISGVVTYSADMQAGLYGTCISLGKRPLSISYALTIVQSRTSTGIRQTRTLSSVRV